MRTKTALKPRRSPLNPDQRRFRKQLDSEELVYARRDLVSEGQ
jgi:hypothetical protein